MNNEENLTNRTTNQAEEKVETTLRPRDLAEFVGQEKLKQNLHVFIEAARKRKEPLDHCLFYSPPGLGKTTLAHIISNELGVNLRSTTGPVLERVGDLAAILTSLNEGDVFFIDEIHRLNHVVEEALYPVMEDFKLDIIIGQGPSAKTIKLDIPKFTLIGATTRAGLLTSPMRARFGIVEYLNFYAINELESIILRSSKILNVTIDDESAHEIALRSRGTPRIANRLLRRIRDFADVKTQGKVGIGIVKEAMQSLGVDALGLDSMDLRILNAIIDKFSGGPVGIDTLSVAVSEEVDTLTDVYEPYLIQAGLLARTARGRVVTPAAYTHLKKTRPQNQQELR
ncbi:MAG: Holliday junction branch migration DNA helicase RuvB [Elusimicrobia bacterium]|nr:Holliday junction branch migration DNA helicase RuvB [Elusimicrobiota bacterium]MBU2615076.1 Holliday junction branch migration DNA helicase RuvB [Elusimicrobiota bacterium]